MLNKIDKDYAKTMLPGSIEAMSHIVGNKFGVLKTRLDLIDDILKDSTKPISEFFYEFGKLMIIKDTVFDDVEEFLRLANEDVKRLLDKTKENRENKND